MIRARLFREACVQHEGSFVKDMSMIGRDAADTIIVDNSPASYLFQPENALPCESFIDDPQDRELYALADMLETIQSVVDVREALQRWTSGACAAAEMTQRRACAGRARGTSALRKFLRARAPPAPTASPRLALSFACRHVQRPGEPRRAAAVRGRDAGRGGGD